MEIGLPPQLPLEEREVTAKEIEPIVKPPVLNDALLSKIEGEALGTTGVVLTVAHQSKMPKLVPLSHHHPRESGVNVDRLNERNRLLEKVSQERASTRRPIVAQIEELGGKVTAEYTLGNAISATIPNNKLEELSKVEGVLHISPAFQPHGPPTIQLGRTAVNSDPWYNDGWHGSTLGLYAAAFDTGVRSSHTVFTSSGGGTLGLHRDCGNGNASCLNNPVSADYNDQDPVNHGTGTASVIMGGISSQAGFGAGMRGTSRVVLDYYQVYKKYANGYGHFVDGWKRAADRALATGVDLVVGEVQYDEPRSGPVALNANDLYDSGITVIAAIGNDGSVSALGSPGNAHKVLGFGDYDAVNNATVYQVQGYSGGLAKPDMQGPTNVTRNVSIRLRQS